MLRKFYNPNVQLQMLKSYPVRDKRLVEKKMPPINSIALGMQPIAYQVAYLRHAINVKNIFFYQTHIPNGIIKRQDLFFNITKK